ncbi:MAG: ATP-binding protein [Melioribacteraceae bacterium]|nr:ATP-binding protein [Melioribacteraceae bacterium]
MPYKKQLNISSQTLFIIFIVITTLIFSSSVFDYIKSKNEISDLLETHAKAFLSTLKSASNNARLSDEMIEKSIEKRLLNNANFIKNLYNDGKIDNGLLNKIADENNLFRINIYDKNGKRLFSNDAPGKQRGRGSGNPPRLYMQDIFNGKKKSVVIGLRSSGWNRNYRFVVAVAANDNSAISLNLEASELQQFKKNIGIEALFSEVVKSPAIEYIVLQNDENRITVGSLANYIKNDSANTVSDEIKQIDSFSSQFIETDSLDIYEASSSFFHQNDFEGIIKIGLNAETYNNVLNNIILRSVISGLFLIIFGSVLLSLVFSRQNYKILEKQYDSIETFSNSIIQSVNNAIIVYKKNGQISLLNESAKKLFQLPEIPDANLTDIFNNDTNEKLKNENFDLEYFNIDINNQNLFLLISKNSFTDENDQQNYILVIKDFTKQKQLEDQINKKEKLVAMGELASGVAHEVRNPLNAIGTIVQQLKKDFIPENNKEEFSQLTDVVYKEVKRINETVQNFLHFAKPLAIFPSKVDLNDIIDQMKMQFSTIFADAKIDFKVHNELDETVFIDKNQIKQVLINLIQNSVDALSEVGKITLDILNADKNFIIKFSDDGTGIAEEKLNHIFNLYYTTKAKGSGIGLSIVQKIIHEHGGQITVESSTDIGTTFFIRLPKEKI